jgi:hypothetical protein
MGYTYFILVGIDQPHVDDEFREEIRQIYEKCIEENKSYPRFGEDVHAVPDFKEMTEQFKTLTVNFPAITFTFHCFVTCGGGRYGVFISIKGDKVMRELEKNFDGENFIKFGDIEFGTSLSCNETYVKNNITIFLNKDYSYDF